MNPTHAVRALLDCVSKHRSHANITHPAFATAAVARITRMTMLLLSMLYLALRLFQRIGNVSQTGWIASSSTLQQCEDGLYVELPPLTGFFICLFIDSLMEWANNQGMRTLDCSGWPPPLALARNRLLHHPHHRPRPHQVVLWLLPPMPCRVRGGLRRRC